MKNFRNRIDAIDVFPIRMPVAHPFTTTYGEFRYFDKVIVRIASESGAVGWGESVASRSNGLPLPGLVSQIEKLFVPRLLGADVLMVRDLHQRMEEATTGRAATLAKAAVAMAAYDLAGTILGVPVSTLLGGALRDRIPVVSLSIGIGSPEEAANDALAAMERGFTRLKVKGGLDAWADVERVRAIHETIGPRTWIRLDANEGYPDAITAIRALRAMEPYGVELVESPLPRTDLHGFVEICRAGTIPMTIHQGLDCLADAVTLLRFKAADAFTISPTRVGGLHRAAQIMTLAEAFSVPFLFGSAGESGIGEAATAHLASVARALPYASDCRNSLLYTEDLLVAPVRIEDGYTFVPDGPGLGVTVDEDAVSRNVVDVHELTFDSGATRVGDVLKP